MVELFSLLLLESKSLLPLFLLPLELSHLLFLAPDAEGHKERWSTKRRTRVSSVFPLAISTRMSLPCRSRHMCLLWASSLAAWISKEPGSAGTPHGNWANSISSVQRYKAPISCKQSTSSTMAKNPYARVNSHQRWKQTRFRVCFHLWCELTSTMNVTEWQVSWNSW